MLCHGLPEPPLTWAFSSFSSSSSTCPVSSLAWVPLVVVEYNPSHFVVKSCAEKVYRKNVATKMSFFQELKKHNIKAKHSVSPPFLQLEKCEDKNSYITFPPLLLLRLLHLPPSIDEKCLLTAKKIKQWKEFFCLKRIKFSPNNYQGTHITQGTLVSIVR